MAMVEGSREKVVKGKQLQLKAVSTHDVVQVITRHQLLKLKTKAIRSGAWYKALQRIDRVLIDLTIKVKNIISSATLTKSILILIEKLEHVMESCFSLVTRTVGLPLAQRLSEIAEKLGNEIFISKSVAPGNGIIFKGDDIKSGETAIYAPEVIAMNHIGTFAALGYNTICVKKKLKCGIISTGDELIPIDSPIDENMAYIRDVNSHMIKTQAESFGCEAVFYGIYKDKREQICEAVEKAYHECDIILVSGGSSAGIMDLTREVFISAAGAEILTHGIAVKPGKPTIIAKAGSKALIGLPGHPVSAFFIMQEIVQYVICSMYGVRKKMRPVIKARLSEKTASNNGRDEFIPVRLQEINGEVTAFPVNYKSGLITLLSKSDGYIWVPRFAEGFDEGTQVEVYMF
jgi:molybdopterin molybdotransferase